MLKGCGSIVLIDDTVLLMYRTNVKFFDNMWSNPGGKVDPGESLEEACIRENREELGVETRIIKQICEYVWHRDGKPYGFFTGFLVEIGGTPTIMERKKAKHLDFFPISQLPQPIAPYTVEYLKELGYDL